MEPPPPHDTRRNGNRWARLQISIYHVRSPSRNTCKQITQRSVGKNNVNSQTVHPCQRDRERHRRLRIRPSPTTLEKRSSRGRNIGSVDQLAKRKKTASELHSWNGTEWQLASAGRGRKTWLANWNRTSGKRKLGIRL